MCKMNVVVNRVMLGNRELGWETWNGKNIEEYTSKQLCLRMRRMLIR